MLIFMDMNHLKQINDIYGHGAGDELLIGAAQSIQKAYGSLGYCFRIGGDEFCAILPEIKISEEELSRRLDAAVEEYNRSNDQKLSVARGIQLVTGQSGDEKEYQ